MFNLIYRAWRIFVAVITLGIVRLEKNTATARRAAIIDQHVQRVASAREDLGTIRGAGRVQRREVDTLAQKVATLQRRKEHWMKELHTAAPETAEARVAEQKAREANAELKTAQLDLTTAQTELDRLVNEYNATRNIVAQAGRTIKDARAKGERQARRIQSAERRKGALEAVASVQGLAGLGGELQQIDDQLDSQLDLLEGQAETTADLAQEEWAEQNLDEQIASQQHDDAFEAELAAARGAVENVIDVQPVTLALTEGEGERTIELGKRTPAKVHATADFSDE